MEEDKEGGEHGGLSGIHSHWWWALASAAQFGWGVSSYRRGVGDSRFMPLKAFAVSSLFVGAGASAAFSVLRASGIHKVEDLMEVGANIRAGLGIHRGQNMNNRRDNQ